MADKSIIDRIKKLLALAKGNTNAAEATAAALKAQKLIADHDVSKVDLYDEPEEIVTVTAGDVKGNPWGKRLAKVIADNFRCQHYYHLVGTRDGWTHRVTAKSNEVVFVGYDTDAQAATVTYNRLFEIGNRLAGSECRKAKRERGTARNVRNSFLLGYVEGIRKELEKQSMALMLVRPKAVDDYYDEISSDWTSTRSSVRNAYHGEAYDSGQRAGRDSVRSARLAGQPMLTA